jgi:plasmid stability protein
MPSITIKNIPQKTYEQLKIQAKRNNRSLNSEIIISLQLHAHRSESASSRILELARKSQNLGKGSLSEAEVLAAKIENRK